MKKLAIALTLAFTAGASADVAFAADKTVIKAATVAPEGTPWSELLKRIKKRYKKQAKEAGKPVKLKVYFGGRLGGEKETLRETRAGRIHMWGGSTGAMASEVAALAVLEAPYLFESSEEADFVLDNYALEHVKSLLAKRGFVFFQFSENGWHGLALKNTCVKSLEDLKGVKVRSQESVIHLATFTALGANPVEMAVPEVLPALEQGVVDGFSNTPLFSFATSWYQGVKHYTTTDHIYQPAVLAYSKKWFDKQPKELQKILLDGAKEDQTFGRKSIRGIRKGLIDNFTKSKIEVCHPDAKLRAELKEATKGVLDEYAKGLSQEGKDLVDAIKKGKQAWAAKKK